MMVRSRVQIVAFTINQMNRTNKAIASELILTKLNLRSVNMPFTKKLRFLVARTLDNFVK